MSLTQEQKNLIKQKADTILAHNNINPLFFDVLRFISKKYDFTIQSRNFENTQLTGMLLVDEDEPVIVQNGKYVNRLIAISSRVVNGDDGCERTCFIALHELWHYIKNCEEGRIRQFATRDTEKKNTIEEQEADYFALCMLMPEESVKKYLEPFNTDPDKIEAAQKLFDVTEKKAKLRLKELGLIGE